MLQSKLRKDKLKILKSCLEQHLFSKANEYNGATVHTSFSLARVITK